MSDDIERCARLMGMKRTEVLEVVPADGGDLVRTHDGQWTLIRDSGVAESADEATAAMLRGFRGDPEPEPTPGPEPTPETKPAPKRRGRA
jgi:hypothetical protein